MKKWFLNLVVFGVILFFAHLAYNPEYGFFGIVMAALISIGYGIFRFLMVGKW